MPDSPTPAPRPTPEGRRLTQDEFDFVHHARLQRRFGPTYDHLRLHEGMPGLRACEGVQYTPARLLPGGDESGALFDRTGARIPASVLRRGREQVTRSTEPAQRAPETTPQTDGQSYLYLGWFQPHFGHFITETLSRFWALRHREPGMKLLVHIPVPAMLGWTYVQDILAGFGLGPDDLVHFDAARTLGRVLVADPALSLESYAYTGLRDAMAPLVAHCVGDGVAPRPEPLYFSRARLKKGVYRYLGEDRLEERLRARGVRILYPETLSVPEQIRAVNAHTHILGIIGSAMHNVMFAGAPRRLTYLTPRWVNPTCLLLDRAFDAQSRYVQVCDRSDVLRAGWSRLRKRLPLLPPPARQDRFHYARNLDMELIDSWLARADL